MSFLQEVRIELIGNIFSEEKQLSVLKIRALGKLCCYCLASAVSPEPETSQEVEVFPKAETARRCPTWRAAAQVIKAAAARGSASQRIQETSPHGVEAARALRPLS